MRRRLAPALAALALGLLPPQAAASEGVVETVEGWTVECHRTEAGGRECQLRNDEAGKPALEQTRLLSFTLHEGGTEAEGLLRIADLDLPPRLPVELGFGAEVITLEGTGRRGRLAARFALPRPELPALAAAHEVIVRFTDRGGQPYQAIIPTSGLTQALALADDYL